jgi:hypothetical protein
VEKVASSGQDMYGTVGPLRNTYMVVSDNEIATVHQRCEIPKVQALCDFYDSYRLGGFL